MVYSVDNQPVSVYANIFNTNGASYIGLYNSVADYRKANPFWDGFDGWVNPKQNGPPPQNGLCASVTSIAVGTAAGDDTIDLSGVDTVYYTNPALNGHISISGGAGADKITGSNFSESINGGLGNDTISAGNGKDTIVGGGGDDTIQGGAGADSIVGGYGNDLIYGNAGNDIILATSAQQKSKLIRTPKATTR